MTPKTSAARRPPRAASRRVEPRRPRLARRRHDRERPGERDRCEDDVEAEDRRPREPLEQDARGEQAEYAAAGGDADPRPDRLAALLGREDGGDHRQRHRHDQRRADAHRAAKHDQLAGAVQEDRRQRSEAEHPEPGGQDRLAAEPVADRTGGKKQRGEGERVRGDDPLQLCLRGAGAARDLGQRDVQARDRADDHHQREAHDPQHRPALLSFVLESFLPSITCLLCNVIAC